MKIGTNKREGGFTLMEMLVVIGLVSMIGAMTLFMDLTSYRGDAFRNEINALGTALQTARADSMNNIDQKKHGVAVFPGGYGGYVIFEGDSYATRDTTRDIEIKASYASTLGVGSPSEIVFSQLSGDANYDGDLSLVDPTRGISSGITINHEGKVSW